MNDPSPSEAAGREAAWVVALGVFVGTSALGLSLVGLLGRLTATSVATCLLAALVASVLYARRSGATRIPEFAWSALPLIVPPALAAALLPPYTWDEVAYGAALPRDFARAGRFFYNSDYGAYAAFPANYEALVTASLLLTSDVRLVQLLNVVLALAMAAIAALVARLLGASKPASLVAGLLVLCAPVLIETSPLTKNDVANAFFQTLAVLVLVACLEERGHLAVMLSGAFLGVSLGIKYSSLHFALALGPFAVLFMTRSAASRTVALKRVSLWLACLALCGSPWYLRNLALLSNPVFPFLNDWLGVDNGFTREHSALLRESFDGLADFSFRTGTLATFLTRIVKGFGVLPMTLLVPGAVLGLRPPCRRAGVVVAGSAVSYLLLTLFAGFWEPRYFLSLLVLSSALAALALQSLVSAAERSGLAPIGPGRFAILVAAVVAVSGAYPRWSEQWRNVRSVWHEGREAFVEDRVRYFAVAQWLNANTSPRDRVAIGFNVQPFYYLERPYYHIHPLTQGDLVTAETPEEVEAALRRVGVTFLAFSGSDGTYFENTAPKISAYRERLWLAQRRLRQAGRLRLVATVAGVRILRLEAGEAPASASPPPAP